MRQNSSKVLTLLLISVLLSLGQCKIKDRALNKVFKEGQRFLSIYRLPWQEQNVRRNLQAVAAKPAPAAPAPAAKPVAPAAPAPAAKPAAKPAPAKPAPAAKPATPAPAAKPVAPAAPAPAAKPAKVTKKPAKKLPVKKLLKRSIIRVTRKSTKKENIPKKDMLTKKEKNLTLRAVSTFHTQRNSIW